ncbi:hypothetical protein C6497_16040 [Candidatus Poribacteria bacterium]|nr:MAG: hypothetical protein C6497_16040 [Candidatus Poribacteria bacterium]
MNSLKNIIERCQERRENPLRQRKTTIVAATHKKGFPYEHTVHCAHGYSTTHYALEKANISFMPIGRAPGNDRGPRTYDAPYRYQKPQGWEDWRLRRWRESWGIQIYTGIPSEQHGAQWHDVVIKYEALCDAPKIVIDCVTALAKAVVNPLLTLTKSGDLRFSYRIPNYLHPYLKDDKFYIYKKTKNGETVYIEVLGEKGFSRWDARYEIIMGNLLDPPIISKDALFKPIDTLRNILHQPESTTIEDSNNQIDEIYISPISLGSHKLDLAKEAFLRRDFIYLQEKNGFHQMTPIHNNDTNKHVSLWERDRIVWVRASTPEFDIPIEATPITDIWDDTGIIKLQPTNTQRNTDIYNDIRQQKLSPLTIKRPKTTLKKQPNQTDQLKTFSKNDIQDFLNSNTHILVLQTDTFPQYNKLIKTILSDNTPVCLNVEHERLVDMVEEHFKDTNTQNFARFKPRMHLWEKVQNIPIDERMKHPFKNGNVCEDAQRCDTLERKGGDPNIHICPHCPVYTTCQKDGYLAQHQLLQKTKVQLLTDTQLFFSSESTNSETQRLKQLDNTQRLNILLEPIIQNQTNTAELSIKRLQEWILNWRGEVLGNFANFLMNAFQPNNMYYSDTIKRIRSTVQAFEWQEEEIVRQMQQINVTCQVTEPGYVDPDTGQELAKFTIKFKGGATAYLPINHETQNQLIQRELPVLNLKFFQLNTDMKIPMSMTQAIEFGILKTDTVDHIEDFPTVCKNPNWTIWHQLKHFFNYYSRNEDVRILWHEDVLLFRWTTTIHPSIKQLIITTTSLTQQQIQRLFPDEKIEFRFIKPKTWKKGNRIFQIRTGLYAREILLNARGNWDVIGLTNIGGRIFARILAEIEKDPNIRHTVISYAAALKQIKELVKTQNVNFVRNTENYFISNVVVEQDFRQPIEESQVIWIAGCPEPPIGNVWLQAQTLYGNDSKPLLYDKDPDTGHYKDERLHRIYKQMIVNFIKTIINSAKLDQLENKTIIIITDVNIPHVTNRPETMLFDWEDFEIANDLNTLPETIAIRERFEAERDKLSAESTRETVERVLGCSQRQANRLLQKFRGGAPLRIPFRDQILDMLTEGDKKTAEFVKAIEGNPEAVKNELKRLVDRGEIVRIRRGIYSTPNTAK